MTGKQVLIVDDSETMRDMISYTLDSAGFAVTIAVDGLDALDKLEGLQVDLVITDINMPRMDGIDLIEALRAKPDFRGTPILCLTTEQGEDTKSAARSAGATGWIKKPFDPDKLVQVARKVCP